MEKYVNKDEVKQREKTIGIPVITRPANLSVREGLSLTPREYGIVTLMEVYDFSRGETAQYLKISRKCLRNNLLRIRRKVTPKPS